MTKEEAVAEIRRSPTGAKLLNKFAKHPFYVSEGSYGTDETIPGLIYWDPDYYSHLHSGGTIDPAVSLAHEIYHAIEYQTKGWDDDSEDRATECEATIEKELGLPVRQSYDDAY